MPAKSTALAITDAAPPPVPMFGASAMAAAFAGYQALQQTLDQAMADQVIVIEGRKFRRKGYWRGVATAFNLSLTLVEERREVHGTFEDGHDNFVWFVVYQATAPNGRAAIGDGACAALEKAPRRESNKWKALPWQATEHNVRSHAHTRAFNRAVSSLVGFGEVSAEELERDDDADHEHTHEPPPAVTSPVTPRRVHPDSRPITVPQQKRLFATARERGWTDTQELKNMLYAAFGITSTKDLRMADFEQALELVERGPRPIDPVSEVP
jgi:hypothetical protein